MTTTRQDIIDQTILPAIASGDFGQDTTERIIDAIFEAAPLSTWSLDGTEYVSTAIDTDGFWSIVEETATACFHPTCAAPAVVNVDLNSWRNPSCMDHLGELCLRLALVASASGSTIVVTFIAQYGPLTWLQNSL